MTFYLTQTVIDRILDAACQCATTCMEHKAGHNYIIRKQNGDELIFTETNTGSFNLRLYGEGSISLYFCVKPGGVQTISYGIVGAADIYFMVEDNSPEFVTLLKTVLLPACKYVGVPLSEKALSERELEMA